MQTGVNNGNSIVVDDVNNRIFWAEGGPNPDTIRRGTTSANCGALSGVTTIRANNNLASTFGLAVDTSAQRLYFATTNSNRVGRLDYNGGNVTNTLHTGGAQPIGIAFDPDTYLLYWSEFNSNDVLKGLADGSGSPSVVLDSISDDTWGVAACFVSIPKISVDFLATNDSTPALSGTVDDPTATVSLVVNGNTHAATNNGDGTWALADNTLPAARRWNLRCGSYRHCCWWLKL